MVRGQRVVDVVTIFAKRIEGGASEKEAKVKMPRCN